MNSGRVGRLRLRPIRPSDAPALVALFNRLSPDSIRSRFFIAAKRADPREAAYFASVDHVQRVALVALASPPRPHAGDTIVGVARFDRTAPDQAELALLVEDAFQGQGLGQLLLRRLVAEARARGIRLLGGETLPGNARMLRLLRASGLPLDLAWADGALRFTLRLAT